MEGLYKKMYNMEPIKIGKAYGVMKMKKEGGASLSMKEPRGKPGRKSKKGGCGMCGNMEHTGCMCHMLGAGKKKAGRPTKLKMGSARSAGASVFDKPENELPDYLKNALLAYENQEENVRDPYTGYSQEELALMPVEQRRKIKRDAEKKRYDETLQQATKEAMKKLRGGKVSKEKVAEKRRQLQSGYDNMMAMKKKQEEEEARQQAEEDSGDWLDDAFDWATDQVINLTSKGLSTFGVPEGLTKGAMTGLKKTLQGLGEPKKPRKMSAKQMEYQKRLKMIREKYGLSFKDALKKYSQMKKK